MEITGVAHGRFQILHLDHLKYLQAAKERCHHLFVGITNPDPRLTKYDQVDGVRSDPAENPLTFFERFLTIRETVVEAGWGLDDFSIVPFPINFPDLYRHYLPLDATFFLTIYDAWGEKKLKTFQQLGLRTHVLWQKPLSEKGIDAKNVRARIIQGEPWEHLVPPVVTRILHELGCIERIRTGRTNP